MKGKIGDDIKFIDAETETTVSERIDYAKILLWQLNRVSLSLSYNQRKEFIQAVSALENLVWAYRDKRYKEAMIKISQQFTILFTTLTPKQKEENKDRMNFHFACQKWKAIMDLMSRKALTPIEDIEDYI